MWLRVGKGVSEEVQGEGVPPPMLGLDLSLLQEMPLRRPQTSTSPALSP